MALTEREKGLRVITWLLNQGMTTYAMVKHGDFPKKTVRDWLAGKYYPRGENLMRVEEFARSIGWPGYRTKLT